MKNILIVAGTYYPDSMATIGITQRLAEELVQKGYSTIVYSVRYNGHKNPGYPLMHNGVEIKQTDDFKAELPIVKKIKYGAVGFRHKLFKKMKIKERKSVSLFNREEKNYKKNKNAERCEIETRKIEQIISQRNIDTLISVALPFGVHTYASEVKRRNPGIRWIPVSFDPYAFDEVTNAHQKDKCISEEIRVLKFADKIMFLTQFENDYHNSILEKKIDFFELPNIRKMNYDYTAEFIDYDKDSINCVFLGNLYLIQRHPQFLFELFYSMNNPNIKLYIVGDLVDLPKSYIDEWVEKFGGRLIYTGRVSQNVAINAMLGADILINIGHATTNQCPSKILDYMSTGKPILSISKIDNCTSLPYFEKYPRVLSVFEKNGISKDVVCSAEDFILNYANSVPLEFDTVEELFETSTMNHMIKKLEQ